MDTAPAAATEALDRALLGNRPSIGVPSIPGRAAHTTEPVPVPSIPLPARPAPPPAEPAPLAAVPASPEVAAPGSSEEETFPPGVRAKLRSYVYLLVDPRTGRPFYVGRGRDDRCFDHVRAARAARAGVGPGDKRGSGGSDDPGDYPVLDRIRQVEASGRKVRIEVLRHGLDPDEALTLEAAAHDLLGLPGDPPGGSQRRSAVEVRSLLTKRAKFKRSHQVVLLRVGPTGSDASYGRARHGWRIGRRWVDVEAPRSPRWAVVVVGELVDSVYRLDRWEASGPVAEGTVGDVTAPGGPGSAPGGNGSRAPERYSFVGVRDPELDRRYVGKSVAPYLGKGSQSSVAYVWCGPHWVNTAQ